METNTVGARAGALAEGARKKKPKNPPLLDFPMHTAVVKSGNVSYLILEKTGNNEAIEVVGRYMGGAGKKDALRPDERKGEFVYKHPSGYHYLLAKVDAADAERIIMERNAPH
jgi:hypothetical protein